MNTPLDPLADALTRVRAWLDMDPELVTDLELIGDAMLGGLAVSALPYPLAWLIAADGCRPERIAAEERALLAPWADGPKVARLRAALDRESAEADRLYAATTKPDLARVTSLADLERGPRSNPARADRIEADLHRRGVLPLHAGSAASAGSAGSIRGAA